MSSVGQCCDNPMPMYGYSYCSRCGATLGQGKPNVVVQSEMYWNYEHFQAGVRTVIFRCKNCERMFRARMDSRVTSACKCSNVQGGFCSEIIKEMRKISEVR